MEEVTLGQQIIQIVIPLATVVVSALVSWALAYLGAYIKARTQNETVLTAYDHGQNIVQGVVAEIFQSVRTAAADGKITKEEAMQLKQNAVNAVNTQFPPWLKESMTNAVGDLNSWINTQIEASVYNLKNGK